MKEYDLEQDSLEIQPVWVGSGDLTQKDTREYVEELEENEPLVGEVDRDFFIDSFKRIKDDICNRGITEEKANKRAWQITAQYAVRRSLESETPYYEQKSRMLENEARAIGDWIGEYKANYSNGTLGFNLPKDKIKIRPINNYSSGLRAA